METLLDFLNATALPMEAPQPYGTFHMFFWIVGYLILFPAAWFLRKTGERGNKILLTGIGGLLLLSEVYKQLFYTFVIGGGEYPYWIFPFQLCSVPMYLSLIVPWLKPGKVRQALYTFLGTYGFMGGFVSYIAPGSMCRDYWVLSIHSFTWHLLLVFIGVYVNLSGRGIRRLRDYRFAAYVYLGLSCVAFGINCLFYNKPGIPVNMFYVGPHESTLVVCSDICATLGWQVNTLIYTSALTLCAFLFYLAFWILSRKLRLPDKN